MDDFPIPWWLVVLLGIGAIGLAVWQSSRWTISVRSGAGALALAYLLLLAYAIGGDPRGGAAARSWTAADLPMIALSGLSLTAAVLLTGRPSFRGQLTWFGVFSLANAGIAAFSGSIGVAALLAVAGIACATLLIRELRRGPPVSAADFWPSPQPESGERSGDLPWLAGVTGLVLAVALVGTIHYALHAESTRATTTRRHSTLPSRARLLTVLNIDADQELRTPLFKRIADRPDVVVLLAALAIVTLAGVMAAPLPPETASVPSDPSPPDTDPA